VSIGGRTEWWAKDCAFNGRELNVELGEEFGPAGLAVIDQLNADAKKQRNGGVVRTGYRSLARTCFLESAELTRRIVDKAAEIGALDDYEPDDDGRRFTARVSGFTSDQQHAQAAARQQNKRDRDATAWGVTERDDTVTECDDRDEALPTEQDRTEENPNTSSQLDEMRTVRDLFGYWQQQCRHPQAKLTRDRGRKVLARLREGYTPEQVQQAIDGAARAAFVNDDGKRFDDLELICRNGSKLEDFIGRAAKANGTGPGFNAASFVRSFDTPGGAAA